MSRNKSGEHLTKENFKVLAKAKGYRIEITMNEGTAILLRDQLYEIDANNESDDATYNLWKALSDLHMAPSYEDYKKISLDFTGKKEPNDF